jgi:hypothetical protein
MLRITLRSGLLAALLGILAVPSFPAAGQQPGAAPESAGTQTQLGAIQGRLEDYEHRLDVLDKQIDDVLWIERVGDVALVDKVRLTGPPPWKEPNPTAIGAGNPLKFYAYVFLPRTLDRSRKAPLLVFPHGGVHSDLSTSCASWWPRATWW